MNQLKSLTETQRTNMVLRQIRPWFVHDENLLNLLYFLPREDFFPDEFKKFAFFDMELELAPNRMTHPPKLEGKILSYLNLEKTHTVLEFGAINGYLTVAMSKLAKQITSFESNKDLLELSKKNVQNYSNIELNHADFKAVFENENYDLTFDRIVINQPISQILDSHLNLLNENGKLFCFEGDKNYLRGTIATLENGKVHKEPVFEFNLKSEMIQTTPRKFDF